jgi:hypothetical protein
MKIISSGWGRDQLVFILLGAMPVGFVGDGLVAGTFDELHTETETYSEISIRQRYFR